jgi:16S rRNA pseudouridine516 synthase
MRIDKFLANQDIGSRSQVKQYIKKGMISVNGIVCKSPEQKIDENADQISYNGKVIGYQKHHYYMLNKPSGCVSATNDNLHITVLDLLKASVPVKNLFPVGRLDIDTEGLLLITDDGELSHNLLSPSKHVAKTYFARIDGLATEEHIKAFKEGLDIGDDKPTKPGTLVIKNTDLGTQTSEILLTITEGRYHQVKRSFEALGMKVIYLKRLSMGSLTLDEALAPGEFRELTEDELQTLIQKIFLI